MLYKITEVIMGARVYFEKEDIISAAMELIQKEGLNNLTARILAKKMNSSVIPIYKHFPSMESLKQEVICLIRKQIDKAAKTYPLPKLDTQHTDGKFLSIGCGLLTFARDHKMLYKALFIEAKDFKAEIEILFKSLRLELLKDEGLKQLSIDEADLILKKMWYFTLGWALEVAFEIEEEPSDQEIINLMHATGKDIIMATLIRLKNNI
jgi:AcrR family transcriptional regulator